VSWMDFDRKLRAAKSLDEVVAAHSLYLGARGTRFWTENFTWGPGLSRFMSESISSSRF